MFNQTLLPIKLSTDSREILCILSDSWKTWSEPEPAQKRTTLINDTLFQQNNATQHYPYPHTNDRLSLCKRDQIFRKLPQKRPPENGDYVKQRL